VTALQFLIHSTFVFVIHSRRFLPNSWPVALYLLLSLLQLDAAQKRDCILHYLYSSIGHSAIGTLGSRSLTIAFPEWPAVVSFTVSEVRSFVSRRPECRTLPMNRDCRANKTDAMRPGGGVWNVGLVDSPHQFEDSQIRRLCRMVQILTLFITS